MSLSGADLRHAIRRLARSRECSITVVLMLGLGIGATTAAFSLIEGILLRPLPFHDPGRLVQLGEHVGDGAGIGITARDVRAYSTQTSAFASMGAFVGTSFALGGGATPENLPAARLTATVFPTLAVQPVLGRVFTTQEDEAHAQVAVLSDALWTRRYHRDPHAIGQVIQLDAKPYTVLGVMPRSFEFPLQVGRRDQSQLWVPMSLTTNELSDEAAGFWGYQMVARLKDGVTLEQAAHDTARVAQQIMRSYPAAMSKIRIRGDVALLSDVFTGDTRPLLLVLSAAVAVVLLIACVNVAILLLVRAVRSQREYAVRLALGASSTVILRGTLFEGLVLSLSGGLLGLGFASIVVRIAAHSFAEFIPRIDSVSINAPVACFALGIAVVTGVLCSLVPAVVARRTMLIDVLKENAGTANGTRGHTRLRFALVVSEVAVALVLLTTSLAFLRSYQKMLAVDPGFQPEHVLVAGYRLPAQHYSTVASVEAFQQTLIERLSNQPGIRSAGIGNTLPSSGSSGLAAYTIEGQSAATWKLKFAAFGTIYRDYFQALGIPLIAGRTFTEQDRADAPLVVVVNQSMARHSWPGQIPIGKRMHVGNPRRTYPWATVIGVVGNTRIGGRDQEINDAWYAPARQPAILYGSAPPQPNNTLAEGTIVVRAAIPPQQVVGTVQRTVAAIDPTLALDQVRTMADIVSTTEAPRRITAKLVSAFGFVSLLLALTGIYAVMSFVVTLRTQEIAIRMALGAQRYSVAALVLRSAVKIVLIGSALGALGSIALSHLIRSFLFNVSPTDPWVYSGSALLMFGIACLAAALPAMRAASTDPIRAMRSTL